jgi:short chain dehydrogenase
MFRLITITITIPHWQAPSQSGWSPLILISGVGDSQPPTIEGLGRHGAGAGIWTRHFSELTETVYIRDTSCPLLEQKMPSLTVVKASNASYAPSYIPTAVFIGGTSGIGEAMAKLLARQTNGRANIIIVGRNKAAAERTIAEFPTLPSVNGVTIKHEFIYCDASSLENVHATSQELLTRLDKINLLVLSLSTYGFKPIPTVDGLELATVLRYYARAKFMHELMPLLEKAQANGEDAKVMSVLSAAMGVKVDLNDLGIKNWSLLKIGTLGTYTDIMVKVCTVFAHAA